MRDYKLHRLGKFTRKCEVRRQHLEIKVPALIICFLIACFVWLYVVGLSHIPVERPGETETTEDTCPGTSEDTDAETAAPTSPEAGA